jgi:hypothetical protein
VGLSERTPSLSDRRVEKLTASDLQTASYLRGKDWRPFVLPVESRFSLGAFGITRDQSSKWA